MSVGSVRGTLLVKVGDATLNLGEIGIPLKVRTKPRHHSGADEVAIEIRADLEVLRDAIEELFRTTPSGGEQA